MVGIFCCVFPYYIQSYEFISIAYASGIINLHVECVIGL